MGMFLDSIAFYWPKDKTREELAPKLESFFEGYGLKLRMKDPTRESYAVYDEDQSCSDVMPELIAALSELTGDYAVGSVCMDSDFAAPVLAKAGKQVDMGYIGTPYGMEGVPGLELTAARWQPLLQPQEEPQKLHDCLFGEFICAEDQLRTLSQLTGLPIFDDQLLAETIEEDEDEYF